MSTTEPTGAGRATGAGGAAGAVGAAGAAGAAGPSTEPVPPGPDALALCGATVVVELDPPEVAAIDVVVDGGRVRSLGTAPDGIVRKDCSGTVIVPGNVCAHHHLYSALARGMPYSLAPPRDFLQVLQRIWWRLDRGLDEDSVRASALRGGLDALAAGTTTIVDHHASPEYIDGSLDVVADALEQLGLRALLCYEVSERDGPGRATAGLAENERFLRRPRRLARGMVGAHAAFTLSDETLLRCAELADGAGTGVHIHVAEDAVDEQDSLARYGRRVVDRLAQTGVLTERALLAHCVHVHTAEAGLVESVGATVVCNPRSNMNNAVGHSPFNHGGRHVAIGTDGIGGDMFGECQAGFFRAREAELATPASWPLERLAAGSRLVGRAYGEPLLGTLRPGAPADLCVLAYDPPTPFEAGNLAGHVVFGLPSARVRDVYVAGEAVLSDGRSTRLDESETAARQARVARVLWRRLEQIPPHPFSPHGWDAR
jgi:putative selenium metabolism protein SsnA